MLVFARAGRPARLQAGGDGYRMNDA